MLFCYFLFDKKVFKNSDKQIYIVAKITRFTSSIRNTPTWIFGNAEKYRFIEKFTSSLKWIFHNFKKIISKNWLLEAVILKLRIFKSMNINFFLKDFLPLSIRSFPFFRRFFRNSKEQNIFFLKCLIFRNKKVFITFDKNISFSRQWTFCNCQILQLFLSHD
jgi:hypothetical protein